MFVMAMVPQSTTLMATTLKKEIKPTLGFFITFQDLIRFRQCHTCVIGKLPKRLGSPVKVNQNSYLSYEAGFDSNSLEKRGKSSYLQEDKSAISCDYTQRLPEN